MRKLVFAMQILWLLSGCAQSPRPAEVPGESDERGAMLLTQPALRLSFDVAADVRANNGPALLEALDRVVPGAGGRQTVVVARVGSAGPDVAMERARNAAQLALSVGEVEPRLYVRADPASAATAGVVDVYVVPRDVWSDEFFVAAMTTEAVHVQPLGGVLRADVARASMSEAFERTLATQAGTFVEQVSALTSMVGWSVSMRDIPRVQVPAREYTLSLPASGYASPTEAIALVKRIAYEAGIVGIDLRADARQRRVIAVGGVDVSMGEGEADESEK